jgi:inner membrane protein
MDSLSHVVLGSAIGVAVMGRRVPVWKAALWGAACGSLPDLDVFIDHGDPIRNMTLHRGESHALFYQTLAAPVLAAIALLLQPGERSRWILWWLTAWIALITHALLDSLTIYGTRLLLPFSDHPYALGSLFIVDPLFTLPLLIGMIVVLRRPDARGRRCSAAALALGVTYVLWSVGAQAYVQGIAAQAAARRGLDARQVLVTPTAFNTVLWRIVMLTPDGYLEGFYSLLDTQPQVHFDAFARDTALYRALEHDGSVARIAWFSQGFFMLREHAGEVILSDLRMGQEPDYVFSFRIAQRLGAALVPLPVVRVGVTGDVRALLGWTWRRLQGVPLPPPRHALASPANSASQG